MLLNPTAAWIWQNSDQANLPALYSDHFGIPVAHAEEDIRLAFASWQELPFPKIDCPQDRIHFEFPALTATHRLNGTTFQTRFATVELAEELLPRLEDLQIGDASPDHTFDLLHEPEGTAVYLDGVRLACAPLLTGARVVLLQEMARLAVPGRKFGVVLHAGAVGTENCCVILAGASFSGKSTLCVSLILSGLLCYSDDSAAFTQDLEVAGMPFAISLREGSWPLFPKQFRTRFLPSNLKGTTPTAPPVALIFVNYQAEATETTLTPVEPFDALIAIQESGFWVEHSQSAIQAFLDWICKIPIQKLTYSDLAAGNQIVHDLLKRS